MTLFAPLLAEISDLRPLRHYGQITELGARSVKVCGLERRARLGDRVAVSTPTGPLHGEIVAMSATATEVMLEGTAEGLSPGAPSEHLGPITLSPCDAWIGRILDPVGRPLDGRALAQGETARALRSPPPSPVQRKRLGGRLNTGLDVFNTALPIVRGQRIGLFAGSGVGKTRLLGQLARGVEADVVVLALVGERGRELRDFVEDVLGPEGMARAVVVAATSDQSPLMRRRTVPAALGVAEHFRDQGLHVLFLCDSVTRHAEAHREIALAMGEPPSLRGFPPSTAHQIMTMAERAGPGAEGQGDITAVFTVLVAGSDMEEPVADMLRGVLDGHVVLERTIAERGRFPAVDLLRSVSRSLPGAASAAENARLSELRRLLGAWERVEMMVQAGLYTTGSDPLSDRAIKLWPMIDAFLAGGGADVNESYERLRRVLEGQAPTKA